MRARTVPATAVTFPQTMAASTIALFAMLGLESASVPAGRVRDPGRNIPRATLVGTLLTAVIYILVSTVPLLLIPQAELAQSSAPFVALLDHELGAGNGRWLALFVVVSGLGALNGWTLIGGNLTATMAAQGDFPETFARLNRGALVPRLSSAARRERDDPDELQQPLVDASCSGQIVTAATTAHSAHRSADVMWKTGSLLAASGVNGRRLYAVSVHQIGHSRSWWALALAIAGSGRALTRARSGQPCEVSA